MKMILVANEHLATSLKQSLAAYFPENDIAAIDFCYPDHTVGTRKLATVIMDALEKNPAESFVILADAFASTAFNETRLLLARTNLSDRSVVITGMNLPLAMKYYGLKDSVPVSYLRSLNEEETLAG